MVAHNDGFALLTNEALPSGTANAPAGSTPVAVLYRYTSGTQSWKTFLGGPGVDADFGLASSPDLNGDLAYSEAAGLYGAYFVITAYTGSAAGHFGDSVKYVNNDGKLQNIPEASSWGCSHNTGIAFEAADAVPFASICAEDQGEIWLNTETRGMGPPAVKISNENVTNGASNEAMGGMSGSYSSLARYEGADGYIFAWVSRGAKNLAANSWLQETGFTTATNRTNTRNVAIARFSDKKTLIGPEASSTVGAADGDSQIDWITTSTDVDSSNAHVAALDTTNALVTWEEITSPKCPFIAMGCSGTFTGTRFQLVDGSGAKVGDALVETDTYVAGDMVNMGSGKVCWPYVSMTWRLDGVVSSLPATTATKMSFACVSMGSNTTTTTSSTASAAASSTAAAVSSVVAEASSIMASTVSTASSSSAAESSAAPATSSVAPVLAESPTSAAAVEASTSSIPVFSVASSDSLVTAGATSSASSPAAVAPTTFVTSTIASSVASTPSSSVEAGSSSTADVMPTATEPAPSASVAPAAPTATGGADSGDEVDGISKQTLMKLWWLLMWIRKMLGDQQ